MIRDTVSVLERSGHRVELLATEAPNQAGQMAARAIDGGADVILCAGGDGTINETASGMAGSNVPLAVIPAGTANVLAMEVGIGADPVRAASRLNQWQPLRTPMGLLEIDGQPPRSFLLMAGVGLDAHLVYHLDLNLKARFGKLAYWSGGFSQVLRELEQFDVTVNGMTRRCSFALVAKVRNYGGDLEIARQVRIEDPQFEVVLFEGDRGFRFLPYFAGVLANCLGSIPGATIVRASELEFRPANGAKVYVQIDGETGGVAPGRVSMSSQQITLLVPRAYLGDTGSNGR